MYIVQVAVREGNYKMIWGQVSFETSLVCQLNFTAVDDYTYILYSGYFWGQCMHEGGGISKL